MYPHGILEFKPAGEPSHLTGIDDPEARKDGDGGPGRSSWPPLVPWRVASPRCAAAIGRGGCAWRSPALGRRRAALAERSKAGDVDAEQQLVTANLGLVLHAVRDYKHCGVPLDDLIQEGNLGLIRAARHFDPATHYGPVRDLCHLLDPLFRRPGSGQQRLVDPAPGARPSSPPAISRGGRQSCVLGEPPQRDEPGSQSPSLDEVARYLGVPTDRLAEARLTDNDQGTCQSLADVTLADGTTPDQDLVTNEDRAMVSAALWRLSPFEAWVICERFGLDDPPGRGIRQRSRDREPAEEKPGERLMPTPPRARLPAARGRAGLTFSALTSKWAVIAGSACSACVRSRRRHSTSCAGFWAGGLPTCVRDRGMAIEIPTLPNLVTQAGGREPDPRPARPADRVAGFDAAAARQFLDMLATPPVGCIELRVLRAAFDRQGRVCRADASAGGFGGSTLAGWFDDHERLLTEAHKLRGVSGYVTYQPRATRSPGPFGQPVDSGPAYHARCRYSVSALALPRHRPRAPCRDQQHRRRAGRGARTTRRDPGRPAQARGGGGLGLLGKWGLDPGAATRLSQRPASMPRFWPGHSRRSTRSTATMPSGLIRPRPTPRG